MTAILVVDDHPLYRAGVASALRTQFADVQVVETGSAEDALGLLASGQDTDVALIDAHLPGMDGYRALDLIGTRYPKVALILISGVDGPGAAERARKAGAAGFFPKSLGVAELVEAIRRVLAGDLFYPAAARVRPAARSLDGDALSLRQLEVLAFIGKGYSNKRIARELQVGERTVKWHVSEILGRLGAENRTQALVEASRRRLISPL